MKSSRWAIGLATVGVLLLGLSFVVRPSAGVSATGSQPTVATSVLSTADIGRQLFRAKGCAACHENGVSGAPTLLGYKPDREFLLMWLKDPASVRPGTNMPDLRLKLTEMEALIAYLEVRGQDSQP